MSSKSEAADPTFTADNESLRQRSGKHDAALDFIQAHRDAVNATLYEDPVYAMRLRRKVDWIVMPFLIVCYTMNSIDKVLLNYAQVMGLTPALSLTGNDFSNASSSFFIAVLIAALPNIYLLQKLPVAKWLGFSLAMWGVLTACHAALRNYAGLLALRILSGAFEATVPSAVMLISAQWYTRAEQAARFSYWFCGLGIGQIFGGLISWAFQHVTTDPAASTSGWRMMFLALGLFTTILGILIMLFVPDTPMQAWFFTTEERINLLEHVRVNQSGIVSKTFQPAQVLEGLLDFQMWSVFFIVLLIGVGGGAITNYSATLLRSFGFSPQQSALLNMTSGAVQIASALYCGLLARNFGLRWVWCSSASVVGVAGAALMAWIPTTNQSGSLAGIFLTNFLTGATPIDYNWVLNNTAGTTKRAFVAAMMNAAFAIGNIIGPQTFRASDAPQYQPAKLALVVCWTVSIALTVNLAGYYYLVNKRRDARSGIAAKDDDISETKAFSGLTDKKNKDFSPVDRPGIEKRSHHSDVMIWRSFAKGQVGAASHPM